MLVTLGESFTISGRREIRLAGVHDFIQRPRIAAKLDAAGHRIRTRHVQFVGGNVFAFIQDLNGALVVFAAVAEHVGEDHDIFHLAQLGQLFIDKRARADILQSNGIEHSGGSFIKTRRWISRHGLGRESLHHETAELVEVDHILELDAIAERPAGGDDWILQLNAGNTDGKIGERQERREKSSRALRHTGSQRASRGSHFVLADSPVSRRPA